MKNESGGKLHPTVYLGKNKCQKSCFGPVKSVQKNSEEFGSKSILYSVSPLSLSSSNICKWERLCSVISGEPVCDVPRHCSQGLLQAAHPSPVWLILGSQTSGCPSKCLPAAPGEALGSVPRCALPRQCGETGGAVTAASLCGSVGSDKAGCSQVCSHPGVVICLHQAPACLDTHGLQEWSGEESSEEKWVWTVLFVMKLFANGKKIFKKE